MSGPTTKRSSLHPKSLSPETKSSVGTFLEHFYKISDKQECNQEWAKQFDGEATLVMGSDVAKGLDDIQALRQGMWEKVSTRTHKVQKVFIGGVEGDEYDTVHKESEECEVVILGDVRYSLRNTEKEETSGGEWSARGKLKMVDEPGKWKWVYYRVFLTGDLVELDGQKKSC
ncbi:hypothetical protein QBC43DRAFT_315658 [Cladorrhinum sp. PSN259]|nr:hypothetical protein QBC43DRAFT_315658 [Cladorrhinum sp. PSN259]